MPEQLGVSDILSTLGLASALNKFEIQEFTLTQGDPLVPRSNRLGDVVEELPIARVEEYELSLIIKEHSVNSVALVLGGAGYGTGANALCITGVTLRQVPNDFPTLSIKCHRHPVLVSGASHNPRKYTITLPNLGWGIQGVLSITGAVPEELTGYTLDVSIDHQDHFDREGTKFLIGGSTNCRLEETLEVLKSTTVTLAAGWFADPRSEKERSAEYKTKTLKHHKHQAPDS
ncbi:MAG: hypothetical protein NZM29_08840 [Nitrospira sp.]|nr:hypothetical protein [Nitrospira sp.]